MVPAKKSVNKQHPSSPETHYPEYDVDTRIKPTAGFWRFMGFTEMTPAFEFLKEEFNRIDKLVKQQDKEEKIVPGLTEETWSYHYSHQIYSAALDAGIKGKVRFRDYLTEEIIEFIQR